MQATYCSEGTQILLLLDNSPPNLSSCEEVDPPLGGMCVRNRDATPGHPGDHSSWELLRKKAKQKDVLCLHLLLRSPQHGSLLCFSTEMSTKEDGSVCLLCKTFN